MLPRLAIGLTLLFLLPILAIHAQPYDAGPLGEILAPLADCAAPCFLGVQPMADLPTAVQMLRAQDSVRGVLFQTSERYRYVEIAWKSYPQAPRPFGFIIDDDVAGWVVIPAAIKLGDIRLVLGEPDRISLATNAEHPPRAAYLLEYPERALHIFIGFPPCQVDRAGFWQLRADGSLDGSFYIGFGTADSLPKLTHPRVELDPHRWAKQIRDICRP